MKSGVEQTSDFTQRKRSIKDQRLMTYELKGVRIRLLKNLFEWAHLFWPVRSNYYYYSVLTL